MEKKFRLFLILVIAFAIAAAAVLAYFTFTRLHDSETRLEREDRTAFAELSDRLSDPENIISVQIQVQSTMGDYARYTDFNKSLLAGLTFAHHEYLWGGTGTADRDTAITVTLYKAPADPLLRRILSFFDETFGTDWQTATEKVVLYMDRDVYRITYRKCSFTAQCDAMTEWINEIRDK